MKNHWHEQIQRYVNGQSSGEEAILLQGALNDNAELRALYLDYMNLDAALGAAAEMAAISENTTDRIATFPGSPARFFPRDWRWVAAAAACAALVVFSVLPTLRPSRQAHPEISSVIASTQGAIARLSYQPGSTFPAWISPTASMLDQPRLSL